MSRIVYEVEGITVGQLISMLESFPTNHKIGFLYENWEEPFKVKVCADKYDSQKVNFELIDTED